MLPLTCGHCLGRRDRAIMEQLGTGQVSYLLALDATPKLEGPTRFRIFRLQRP